MTQCQCQALSLLMSSLYLNGSLKVNSKTMLRLSHSTHASISCLLDSWNNILFPSHEKLPNINWRKTRWSNNLGSPNLTNVFDYISHPPILDHKKCKSDIWRHPGLEKVGMMIVDLSCNGHSACWIILETWKLLFLLLLWFYYYSWATENATYYWPCLEYKAAFGSAHRIINEEEGREGVENTWLGANIIQQ